MSNKYGVLPDLVLLQNIVDNIWAEKADNKKVYKYESAFKLRPTLVNDLKRFGYTVNEFSNKNNKYIYEIRW